MTTECCTDSTCADTSQDCCDNDLDCC